MFEIQTEDAQHLNFFSSLNHVLTIDKNQSQVYLRLHETLIIILNTKDLQALEDFVKAECTDLFEVSDPYNLKKGLYEESV